MLPREVVSLVESDGLKPYDSLPMIRTGLSRRGGGFMIRDTFETNPGLCELFKRKMIERARFVGLNKEMIDFEGKIDMKGSYHDNLRIFYREYPRLSTGSDYARLKPPRALAGAALEEAWQSYVESTGHETLHESSDQSQGFTPQLTVTYFIGGVPATEREDKAGAPDAISMNPTLPDRSYDLEASTHRELLRLILDRVTEMAGESVTKAILHQIRQEIGTVTCRHRETPSHSLVGAVDETLTILNRNRR